jgi:hypothetical protein
MSEVAVSARVDEYLVGLARRLRENPDFMAYVLAVYQAQEHLQNDDLVDRLNLRANMLARLALCKRPSAESPDFADQVRQIAAYAGVEPAVLAAVIRQVDSLEPLAGRPESLDAKRAGRSWSYEHTGLLTAARDRCELDEEPGLPPEETPASDN